MAVAGCGDNLRPADPGIDAGAPPIDVAPVDNDPTHIKLSDGEIRGSVVGTSRQFLGVPYARPPVGDLRWKAPQKPAPWTTPLEAKSFGKRCAQLANTTLQNAASSEEDCLYLNVWTPSPAPQTALPVMLWFHGGGNVNGSASEPLPFSNGAGLFYSGQFLAQNHGVIVVSINYRLGLFGFFSHPGLPAEARGNQGLLDQRMAMQWVHDNIAKLGGDPTNVTIFGESAGAQDVCFHVASPGSRGLFHRAISQSGGCTTRLRSKAGGETVAVGFATALGCADAATALTCLRGKAAADLMASNAVTTPPSDGEGGAGFGPDVDGTFLPEQPRKLFIDGEIAKVPYLLGSNADEGTLFVIGSMVDTEVEYLAALAGLFGGATADLVADAYPVTDFATAMPNPALAALARAIGDSRLVCTTYDSAVRAATAEAPVYMYNFDVAAAVDLPGVYLGATHGAELTSVFGTATTFSTEARTVSALIQRYWTNFARTGDPNDATAPAWARLTTTANVRMSFALTTTGMVSNFRRSLCAFWSTFYDGQFPPVSP